MQENVLHLVRPTITPVALYGGTQWGDFALRFGAAYTWHEVKVDRSIAFPGFSDATKGRIRRADRASVR